MRFLIILFFLYNFSLAWAQEIETVPKKEKPAVNSNTNAAPSQKPSFESEEIQQSADRELKKDEATSKNATAISVKLNQLGAQFKQVELQSNVMRTQRTPTVTQQKLLNDAVKNLEDLNSKSFEYNFYKYVSGNHNTSWFSNLAAAEKLEPKNNEVQAQLASYYLIMKNETQALNYLKKLVSSGKLGSEPIALSHDLLQSVAQNGVLVTHGADDTYACVYTQMKDKLRQDVVIVSLELLQSETYRKSLTGKGYQMPSAKVIDVNYLTQFCQLNQAKNISISMTLPKEYLTPLKSRLYTVGLLFEYHTDSFDNYSMNDFLWNKKFNKDLIKNAKSNEGKELSANYLPMLLILQEYYGKIGEKESLNKVNEAIDLVAKQSNKQEIVKKLTKSD